MTIPKAAAALHVHAKAARRQINDGLVHVVRTERSSELPKPGEEVLAEWTSL